MKFLAVFLLLSTMIAGQARQDVATVLKQGADFVRAGQLSSAQDLFEHALHDSPDDPELYFELGMVYFREREWSKAIESYTSSLKSRPGKIRPLFYLAEAYFMGSDLDRARETIAQAASIAPNDAQVCQKYGEYLGATLETRKQAISWLERARRLNPNLARIDFEMGKTQFDLTDFVAATSSFGVAVKKDANDGEASFYLGESWANIGDWEKARDAYAYSLAHGYADGVAFYGLGRAMVELGDFEGAVAPLRRAIELRPSLTKAHFQLSRAYRQLGRSQEAQNEARLFAAMTDRVDISSALYGAEEEEAWNRVKPLLQENKEVEALDLLATLPVSKDPDHGELHYLLGAMYYSMGRKDDAKRMLTIARSKVPESARIAAYLGMVQLNDGEGAAAEESFQSALALNSGEPLALIGIGGIRYHQKRWVDAIESLEKSRTANPDTLLLLCDAYYQVGQPEQALLIAEVIRALGDGRKPLLDELQKLVALHQDDRPRVAP